MYKRDFLQRLIEDAAKVVARILKLKMEGRSDKALEVLNEAIETYTGHSFDHLDKLPAADFIENLQTSGLEPERMELMAHLLIERGKIQSEQEPGSDYKDNYTKALLLLEHLNKLQQHTFSLARFQKISEIKSLVALTSL